MRNYTEITEFILLGLLDDTEITEFILLGLLNNPQLQIVIFVFLVIYGLTVTGKPSIITIISMYSRLQTPMYLFLRSFSILEVSSQLSLFPSLATIITEDKTISFNDCMTLVFFFTFSWESLSFTFWLPCPMTATLPSANHCIT